MFSVSIALIYKDLEKFESNMEVTRFYDNN